MKANLEALYKGQSLNAEETRKLFCDIFAGNTDPVVLSSLLTALKMNGYTAEEIGGAASAIIDAAVPFPRNRAIEVGEIVGTGGDRLSTINISTMAGILCASMGLHVAKHGNTAVSSKSGASDVLTSLGYDIRCSEDKTLKNLEQEGFAFFFAQIFHKGMRFAAPVRKALGTSTIFNILGPLTNPARVDYELLGCYDPALLPTLARALHLTGVKRAMVINGNGMDEISIFGKTKVAELKEDGSVDEYELDNSDFGIAGDFNQKMLEGGDADHNAEVAKEVLAGRGSEAQKAVVAVNAAAMLYLAQKVKSLKEGYSMSRDALASGKAYEKLQAVCTVSKAG